MCNIDAFKKQNLVGKENFLIFEKCLNSKYYLFVSAALKDGENKFKIK